MSTEKEQMGYRIDARLKKKFDRYCEAKGLRKSIIVERLIAKYLEKQVKKESLV